MDIISATQGPALQKETENPLLSESRPELLPVGSGLEEESWANHSLPSKNHARVWASDSSMAGGH